MNVAPKDVQVPFVSEEPEDAVESEDGAPSAKKRKAANGSAVVVESEKVVGAAGNANGLISTRSAKLNPIVLNVVRILKKELMEFLENLTLVKIWIQLNIPRIEDGNNFGVTILEETLGDIVRAEEAACSMLESCPKYYLLRAKYITKTFKYPGVEDFKRAVHELDSKEYNSICMTLTEIRNNYSILHDMISKNWEKILKPRSESTMVY